MHHLDNLDLRAICAININCPRLKILKFSGCNFVDRLETLDEDDVFQMNLNRRTETELMCQLVPWFDMKELLFASECPRQVKWLDEIFDFYLIKKVQEEFEDLKKHMLLYHMPVIGQLSVTCAAILTEFWMTL